MKNMNHRPVTVFGTLPLSASMPKPFGFASSRPNTREVLVDEERNAD